MALTIDEIPQTAREALCLHEALRRLGFEPSDIYVAVVRDFEVVTEGPGTIAVVLETQGQRFATCAYAPVADAAVFLNEWASYAGWWNGATEEDRLTLWTAFQEQYFYGEVVARFVMAIILKGIELSCAVKDVQWN